MSLIVCQKKFGIDFDTLGKAQLWVYLKKHMIFINLIDILVAKYSGWSYSEFAS